MKRPRFLTLAVLALALAACAGRSPPEDVEETFEPEEPPLLPVDFVDLDRYMGRWYMIANIPYFAESGNLAPYVEYSRRDDGLLNNMLTAWDAFDEKPFTKQGYIEITDPMSNAQGLVTFLRPLWQEFAVVYLDDDYQHTVIAHPSRNYCWLFGREPYVDDETYQAMLQSLEDNGFDTSRVLKFPRTPSEQGLPGYQ